MSQAVNTTVYPVNPNGSLDGEVNVNPPSSTQDEKFDVEVNVNPPSSNQENASTTNVFREELNISSDNVLQLISSLVHEATIRRILIKTQDEKTLLEIPFSLGVVGGVVSTTFFPLITSLLTALGTTAALATRLKIIIERVAA